MSIFLQALGHKVRRMHESKGRILLFLLAAVPLCIASTAGATVVRILPTDDTFVNSYDATTMFGDRPYLILGEYHSSHPPIVPPPPEPNPRPPRTFAQMDCCHTVAYLRFELPASVVPSGAVIQCARLRMNATMRQRSHDPTQVDVYRLQTDCWCEEGMCWNNCPHNMGCDPISACQAGQDDPNWDTWAVLGATCESVASGRTLSFAIKSSGPAIVYSSSESIENQPYLEIHYSMPPGEPRGRRWPGMLDPTLGAVPLAIQKVQPNPAPQGHAWVSLSLATAEPASMEVLDLAGRRISRHHLAGLEGGYHVVPLELGARVAPGTYVVRLMQGGRFVTSKLTIVD